MWPHCCPPFKWLRGGNLEVEGREGIFDEKIHYSVLFLQSLSFLFTAPLAVGKEYLLHKW